ncbi:hypothetical protein VNO77_02116 [Canavalia gladiata]|uniref:Uncharacterized protein n=1 Tax=Canavalia gladiata TaxID=3824 RepID=A0AAN9R5L9_CANGL
MAFGSLRDSFFQIHLILALFSLEIAGLLDSSSKGTSFIRDCTPLTLLEPPRSFQHDGNHNRYGHLFDFCEMLPNIGMDECGWSSLPIRLTFGMLRPATSR